MMNKVNKISFELLPKLHGQVSPGDGEKTITTWLPKQLSGQVLNFSGLRSVQPSTVFLAVFKLLLYKYSGRKDLIVGVSVGKEEAHGPDILPVRIHFDEDIKFGDFLLKVQSAVTEVSGEAADPLPENTIYPVTYAYISDDRKKETGRKGDPDLALTIIENDPSFSLHFAYNPGVYTLEMLRRFSDNYMVLLSEVTEVPDRMAVAYPIITEQEKQKLITTFNNTRFDYPKDKCIHRFFEEKAAANPGKTAVIFEDEQLSYQELYDQCRDLALFLQSLGVRPDSLVGLCLERSVEMMLGIHGILIAGGAYVPMNPDYPDDRLTHILQDSQASIVLCGSKWKDKLASLVKEGTTLIALDEEREEIVARVKELKEQKVSLHREAGPRHLAYIIYTSGSTGKPKGVMIEHQALVNRIDWMQRMYPLNEKDVVLQKTPFSFDVSVWEFVWPVMAGASLVFARPGGHKDVHYLEGLINKTGVTTLHFVPSMLHAYLDHAQSQCKSIKQLFCSGEALDCKLVGEYKNRFPRARLHNLYGPTEAAIDVTFYDCSQLHTPFVPIGAPISNIRIYILDKYGNPQPLGVPGELHIAGDGLARGYHNRPELTGEKFIANPFSPGSRMYKSGDLARWMEDGNIEYLGRIDTQVKIRGFRIETGEIETRFNQHPDINNCAVVVQGEGTGKKLVAFYHAKDTRAGHIVKLPAENLRLFLLQALPDYMLPAAFVSLEEFPVTSNGKLDRHSLASMNVDMESGRVYVAPRNDTEQQLVRIWGDILGIEPGKIGVDDNFFELGGHSLLITPLLSKIRDQFAVDLPLNAFFDLYTIAGVAEVIKAVNNQGEEELGDIEFEEFTL